jgi:hypothetical protein
VQEGVCSFAGNIQSFYNTYMMAVLHQLADPPMDGNPKAVGIHHHGLDHSMEVLLTVALVLKYQLRLNLGKKIVHI